MPGGLRLNPEGPAQALLEVVSQKVLEALLGSEWVEELPGYRGRSLLLRFLGSGPHSSSSFLRLAENQGPRRDGNRKSQVAGERRLRSHWDFTLRSHLEGFGITPKRMGN